MRTDETVRLTVVPDEGEAEILCGLLRTEGIACSFRSLEMGRGLPVGSSFGGEREILVFADDLVRARDLLPTKD